MIEKVPKYDIKTQNNDLHELFSFYGKADFQNKIMPNSKGHSHNYYIITILYEGTISHYSDFENNHIVAPALLLLDIDQVHIHPELGQCQLASLAFSPDFIMDQHERFSERLNHVFARPFIRINQKELDQLDEVFALLEKYYLKKNPELDLIKALLNVLIVQCDILSAHYPISDIGSNAMYLAFKMELKRNYFNQHQVKFYADKLHVNTNILNQVVKRSTLKTPKQLIDEHLLREAKRLLYWSEVSVKELAWKLGFETDSYFNRFFKKHTGITPKEFRRNGFVQ